MPDWVVRALRTAAQAAVAALVVALPANLPDDPIEVLTTAGVVAAWAAIVGLVSAVHNHLEDSGRIRDRKGHG